MSFDFIIPMLATLYTKCENLNYIHISEKKARLRINNVIGN